ncbi:MAG: phytanoyl-CoA dioxygenase family protein [Fimbriimonadaceae bacterium]
MMQSGSDQRRLDMTNRGYTIFDSLFTREEMVGLDQCLAQFEERLAREGLDEREVVFTQKIAERDDLIRAFAQRDEFVEISVSYLGPDTDLYFNQKVYKNPHGQNSFSWHQDDAYGPVEPAPYLTVWIAISDATPENGCISVLPGSHNRGLVDHWEGSFGLECHRSDDPDQGMLVPLQAGSAAVFWSQTMHKSGPNKSNEVRKALVLQFAPLGLRHKSSGMLIRSRIPIARNGVAARVTKRA